jgi:hypothetical protein
MRKHGYSCVDYYRIPKEVVESESEVVLAQAKIREYKEFIHIIDDKIS